VEYDTSPVAMEKGEHKSEAFLKVNPFGKLPALNIEGGQPIIESGGWIAMLAVPDERTDFGLASDDATGAILMYLADKYGGLKTPEDRALANQWFVFTTPAERRERPCAH
jgi:glutathione S-transferase